MNFNIISFLTFIFISLNIYAQSNSIIYHYESLNRVEQIEYPDGSLISFTYDEVGNRTSTTIVLSTSASRSNLKTFLEGCYSNGQMLTLLNSNGYIPKDQPFNIAPWNYSGIESVTNIPPNIVEWILIEIRTGLLENTKIATRAAFLKTDGTIVDLDGTSQVSISTVEAGNYYVVIRHRNHLDIMSSSLITISSGTSTLYDFTTSQSQAYGNSPMIDLGDGNFGMYVGDADADGNVDYNDDVLLHWLPNFGLDGYLSADFNLSGTVEYTEDLLNLWLLNFGFSSQVPEQSLNLKLNDVKNINNDKIQLKLNENNKNR